MASLALQLKSHYTKPSQILLKTTTSTFNFPHFFSSSSSNNNNDDNNSDDKKPSEKPYAFSGYFKDIKSKLKNHEQHQPQPSQGFKPFNFTPSQQKNSFNEQASKGGDSLSEIKKNLSEFRRRSTEFPQSQQPNLYQKVGSIGGGRSKTMSVDNIRESLRKSSERGSNLKDAMSLNTYKKSLKMEPVVGSVGKVIGGTTKDLPMEVFGQEMRERERGEAEGGGSGDSANNLTRIELARFYNYDDLGRKLRELRPEVKGKKKSGEAEWFSLSELNERVKKIKQIEEQQMNEKNIGVNFMEFRKSLLSLQDDSGKLKNKNAPLQGINLLPQPNMNASPKEHLIERYFHPDNMSSEEKMKLKLKAMRDEFKIHESDCGSTRVQIAQLTTEILHLSSVLHKKDKHSRRGLQAKVQQRKKLLKYLRRTDWESYSFVLSKLGLRDNPDYKN